MGGCVCVCVGGGGGGGGVISLIIWLVVFVYDAHETQEQI